MNFECQRQNEALECSCSSKFLLPIFCLPRNRSTENRSEDICHIFMNSILPHSFPKSPQQTMDIKTKKYILSLILLMAMTATFSMSYKTKRSSENKIKISLFSDTTSNFFLWSIKGYLHASIFHSGSRNSFSAGNHMMTIIIWGL